MTGCAVLNTLISRFHDPLNARNPGLTIADIALIANNLHLVKTLFNQAIDQVNQLQPNDVQFDPRLGKAITAFHTYLPTLRSWVNDAEGLIAVLPSLLGIGIPAHYLIEVLDTTELRPAGGFIGRPPWKGAKGSYPMLRLYQSDVNWLKRVEGSTFGGS